MSSGLKLCRTCGKTGPEDLFAKLRSGRPQCYDCFNEVQRGRYKRRTPDQIARDKKASRAWKQRQTPEQKAERRKRELAGYHRSYWKKAIERKYGITFEDYERMRVEQDGRCAICREELKLAIDHCHHAGHVRGLLCTGCNVGIGSFRDSPENLERAAAYLRQRGSTPAISN